MLTLVLDLIDSSGEFAARHDPLYRKSDDRYQRKYVFFCLSSGFLK